METAFLKFFDDFMGSVREPLIVLDSNLLVVKANKAFYTTFHVESAHTEGTLIYNLGNQQWNIPQL